MARTRLARMLDAVERMGNRLPDPAAFYALATFVTWIVSAWLDGVSFEVPAKVGGKPQMVQTQLSAKALTEFFADMLATFAAFQPLGIALLALLGLGVAERSGFLGMTLKSSLRAIPKWSLAPLVILSGLVCHSLGDAAYALVIPLGGIVFLAAGRHPLAGLAAAFAGVAGGYSANPLPSGLDPQLRSLTQEAVRIVDPSRQVDPLCNWTFNGVSCVLIAGLGWLLTDKLIEPRLAAVPIDDVEKETIEGETTPEQRRGARAALIALVIGVAGIAIASYPHASPLRTTAGSLLDANAPFMRAIVPLVLLLLLVCGVVYGYTSGVFSTHRDVVKAMDTTMSAMGGYLVMALCASLFFYALTKSKLGALFAVVGGKMFEQMGLGGPLALFGAILLCAVVNLWIAPSAAKWALLAPILVPMLMRLGMAPELAQAAYRVGDSVTDIVTPLFPYFPLMVACARRYLRATAMGTVFSLMLPYAVAFLLGWTALLSVFWITGIPLGIRGVFHYP